MSKIEIALKQDDNEDKQKTAKETDYKILQAGPLTTMQDNKEEENLEPTAEELRKIDIAELTRNLLFDQKDISLFKVLCHLCTGLDYFCLFFAVLGSLGAGIAMPMIAFLTGDSYSSVGDSNDFYASSDPLIQKAIRDMIDERLMTQVRKFLYVGAGMLVANFLNVAFWTFVGFRVSHQLKINYFKLILEQEQGWFDSNNAFEFATKVQAQLEQVELGIGEKIGNVIMMISQLITGLVIAFTTSWKLTLAIIAISPLIVFAVSFLASDVKKGMILSRKTYEKAGGMAEEMLYNIKTIASFANFDFERERFHKKINLVYQIDLTTALRIGVSLGLLIFFLYCSYVIAFCYGRTLIMNREINSNTGRVFKGGDVTTVIFSTVMAIMSFGMIAPNLKLVKEACVATSDYFTLLERQAKIDTSKSTLKPDREKIKGRIEFIDVSFNYTAESKSILNKLNVLFDSGKKIALVGESGCGKSTIVNLIERLYETQEGQIQIDGINVKEYDLNYLRSIIGYVQQEPILFNQSIRDNIIFGREDQIAKLGDIDELIKDACDDTYSTEFISILPEKLNYVVGIKGSKLSGGQKQRIAIARAILMKPKILILDEATSALDNKSEKEVQRALDNISKKNVTTIIIAHRLSTIKNADLIYAIKNGMIIEQGTHKELLEKKGYYAGLVKSQLAKDELESKEDYPKSKKNTEVIVDEEGEASIKEQEKSIAPIVIPKDKVKVSTMRLFHELKDNKLNVFLATLGAIAVGVLNPIFGYMMAKSMNALNSSDKDIVDVDGLFYGLMFLVFAAGNGLSQFLYGWKNNTIVFVLSMLIKKKVLSKYLALHLSFFDLNENSPGALLTSLAIDTIQIYTFILNFVSVIISIISLLIVCLAMAFAYDWRLTLILIVFIPIISITMLIRICLKKTNKNASVEAKVEAGSILSECVINTKTIFSFNFQRKAMQLYESTLSIIKRDFSYDSFVNGIFYGIGQFAIFAANASAFYAAKCFLLENSITSQNMALAINIVMLGSGAVGSYLGMAGDYERARSAFRNLFSTIDTKTLIDQLKEGNRDKLPVDHLKGKIEFRDVTFAYPTRPNNVILKNISFTIQPGQSVAFVGYSGSGKSTIIQLIERFYDLEDGNGEILIDDINIKQYNLYELRKKIGLVSQEPVLFKRSVMENVRYGKLDASNEEVIKAAENANIMKLFSENKSNQIMDQGKGNTKDADVGTKEDPVSGGEKQRLAIARVFLKDPTILLLDEATSALDRDSEAIVQESINKLVGGRTSITIAHRLSTIEQCSVIFVLESGRIVEKGSHEYLMGLQQKYYSLHRYSEMD